MRFNDITKDIPHVFNTHGECVYCDALEEDVDAHCEAQSFDFTPFDNKQSSLLDQPFRRNA